MDDRVFRTLLRTEPGGALGRELLRSLHSVCSAGRLAALRTTIFLHLDYAQELGVPYSCQVAVLAAADKASVVHIQSGQIAGLLRALLAAQQQQQLHVARQEQDRAQQGLASGTPAIKPQGPHIEWFSVAGKLPQQGMWQLMQLLDALPGAQHLQRLRLVDMDNDSLWGVESAAPMPAEVLGAPPSHITHALCDEEHSSSGEGTSSSSSGSGGSAAGTSSTGRGNHHGGASSAMGRSCSSGDGNGGSSQRAGQEHTGVAAGPGGSWRSSCSYLEASQSSGHVQLSQLRPLLEALPNLRELELQDICVTDLPQCVGLLGSVQHLVLSGTVFGNATALAGAGGLVLGGDPNQPGSGPDVAGGKVAAAARALEAVAGMTQLQTLSLADCTPDWDARQRLQLPESFSNLRQLRSLGLSGTEMHSSAREVLPGLEGLEELHISGSCLDAAVLTNTLPRLTNLTCLIMRHSPISSLPEGMAACSRLRKLAWARYCPYLLRFKAGSPRLQLDVVWHLTSLESLSFSDDTLAALPAGITQLTRLTELNLAARSMSEPPAPLSSLVNLRRLRVESHTQHALAMLEVVTTLTQLTGVYVHSSNQGLSPEVEEFLDARTQAFWQGISRQGV